VFGWLREAAQAAEPAPALVPVVVDPAEPAMAVAAFSAADPDDAAHR
jgi:hypothetical protein